MRILTSAEMKCVESLADGAGVSYEQLMENAGSAAAAAICAKIPVEGLSCLVVCGCGNNGGDGFVVARKLWESGARVAVALAMGLPKTAQSIAMLDRLRQTEVPVWSIGLAWRQVEQAFEQADIVVDAMFGTGFCGELSGEAALMADHINSAVAAVFALDLPSGVASDSGFAAPSSVRADFTIAFDSLKPAHLIYPGREYAGETETVSIGVPEECRGEDPGSHFLIGDEMIFSGLKKRPPHSHKGDFGRLLNICGSPGMPGAAVISALSAARCGVGLLTVASSRGTFPALNVRLPEAMVLPLEETVEGHISAENAGRLLEALARADACLVGCGMGNSEDTQALMRQIVLGARCPLVIDADGINALLPCIDILQEAKAPVILTPHMGEMARLAGCSVRELEQHRTEYAQAFAQEHRAVIVLKSSTTTVVTPEGAVFLNCTGNAGLASGGSGDLLAGMIASFCAQGYSPLQSAAAGVYLHGAAADRCAARLSQYAMLPTDILTDLSAIFLDHGF